MPKCEICKSDHPEGKPHVWFEKNDDFNIGEVNPDELESTEKMESTKFKPVDTPVKPMSPGYKAIKKWRYSNRDKYNSYQRDLMRKRRALKPCHTLSSLNPTKSSEPKDS